MFIWSSTQSCSLSQICIIYIFPTGNVIVTGSFYGSPRIFQHDKNEEWLGVAVDVAPSNNKVAVTLPNAWLCV